MKIVGELEQEIRRIIADVLLEIGLDKHLSVPKDAPGAPAAKPAETADEHGETPAAQKPGD